MIRVTRKLRNRFGMIAAGLLVLLGFGFAAGPHALSVSPDQDAELGIGDLPASPEEVAALPSPVSISASFQTASAQGSGSTSQFCTPATDGSRCSNKTQQNAHVEFAGPTLRYLARTGRTRGDPRS